jgi:hypothetical protein
MPNNKFYSRMVDGAHNYAAADRSDPFALARAMAHIRSGLCGLKANGDEAIYSAQPYIETRKLPSGEEYTVTAYKNAMRP